MEEFVMAFFDWNRNGKIDAQDMFLEYNTSRLVLKMMTITKTYLFQMMASRNMTNSLMSWMKSKGVEYKCQDQRW